MKKRRVIYWVLLAAAVVLTALSALPVADVPVKVYENTAAVVPLFAVGACLATWGSLLFSERKPLNFGLSVGLTTFAVCSLCRAVWALCACYAYYAVG